MSNREFTARFQSPLAAAMGQFVQQKQACGYKYGEAARYWRGLIASYVTKRYRGASYPAPSAGSGSPNNATRAPQHTSIASGLFVSSPRICAGWAIPPMFPIER